VDDRRWISGDGSWETGDNQSPSYMKMMRLCGVIPFSRSRLDFKLRSFNGTQIYMYTMYRRHGSTKYDTEHYSEHYSEIPNHAPTCPSSNAEYNPESDPELQQQCRYRPSRTRLIFGGATICKEGDDCTGIKTNPYCKQSPYRKCWEEAPWSALTGRNHQQCQQAYVKKSQQCTWR
jgi:hypothetical protein